MSASRTRFGREGQVCGRPKTRLVELGAIDSIANACAVNVTLGGRAIGAVGLTSLRGAIEPTVLEGRAPRSDDEVALGTETMRSLDAEVGARVTGEGSGQDDRVPRRRERRGADDRRPASGRRRCAVHR